MPSSSLVTEAYLRAVFLLRSDSAFFTLLPCLLELAGKAQDSSADENY